MTPEPVYEATAEAWAQLLAMVEQHGDGVGDAIMAALVAARDAGRTDAVHAWYRIGAALVEFDCRPALPN
ncbi:hypothetical protein [Edaphosphingomonas haloaromaticamans]|uniref:Uncharacterized protein n=1 Tax=Edaphosphingomonas haloaromaticamans TaxID=653954 RepID=A0A1S1HCM9_9SPHN|nr:hypothetical protein [Sphingomonas haloaromaticamans]OHT19887.1 hypothetical protein BHE75_01880 [Sphingomonas haloaromaticamans]